MCYYSIFGYSKSSPIEFILVPLFVIITYFSCNYYYVSKIEKMLVGGQIATIVTAINTLQLKLKQTVYIVEIKFYQVPINAIITRRNTQ